MAFSTPHEEHEFPSQGHLRFQSQCLFHRPPFCSLGKRANARKEIKVCLAFPTGPVNRAEEDSSCHAAQAMGPRGPGTARLTNVFAQRRACSSHFASGLPLLSALGNFYHLGGLPGAAFTKSLLDHQNRQTVRLCGDEAHPREPSQGQTEGSPAREQAGGGRPREHPLNAPRRSLLGPLWQMG